MREILTLSYVNHSAAKDRRRQGSVVTKSSNDLSLRFNPLDQPTKVLSWNLIYNIDLSDFAN